MNYELFFLRVAYVVFVFCAVRILIWAYAVVDENNKEPALRALRDVSRGYALRFPFPFQWLLAKAIAAAYIVTYHEIF